MRRAGYELTAELEGSLGPAVHDSDELLGTERGELLDGEPGRLARLRDADDRVASRASAGEALLARDPERRASLLFPY